MNLFFYLVAAAITTVSITVTRSVIFKPIRKKLPYPFHCPYCFSHYLAIPAALTLPWLGCINFIITALALVCASNVFMYPILLNFELLEKK